MIDERQELLNQIRLRAVGGYHISPQTPFDDVWALLAIIDNQPSTDNQPFDRDPQRFVSDGEVIWIDRKRFKLERDPRSNEQWEIIKVVQVPAEGEK